MSMFDDTFGAADEDLCGADEHTHSVALERLQHDLRLTMRAHEQRARGWPSAGACGAFARQRRALIEWMCDGADRLALHRSTFHTASNLLDRTLSQTTLAHEGRLGLISIACLRIAAKHCEAESAVPHLAALVAECGERYTELDIARMEIAVLTQLEWRVHCNTAYDFVGVLGLTSLIRAGDEINGMAVGPSDPPGPHTADVDLLIRRYAGFFVDLSVYEFPHGSQPASLTAAAAVAAARVLFSVSPTWPDCLRRDSGYAQPALHETLSMLLDIFMHDFSDDWANLQQMASGIAPFAAGLRLGERRSDMSCEQVLSPTSVADIAALSAHHAPGQVTACCRHSY